MFIKPVWYLYYVRPLCTSFHCIDETSEISKSISNLSQSVARGHLLILTISESAVTKEEQEGLLEFECDCMTAMQKAQETSITKTVEEMAENILEE